MSKVYFSGYYGMNNFGDDIFGIVSSSYVNKKMNLKPYVSGPEIGGCNINYTVPGFLDRYYSNKGFFGAGIRFINGVKSKVLSDNYVYAGGSLFSNEVRGTRRFIDLINTSEISAIGVSVGPFKDKKTELKISEYLRKFRYISVRDHESYEILKRMDLDIEINKASDLAGLLPILPFYKDIVKEPKKNKIIGFTPCSWKGGNVSSSQFCENFSEAIKKVNEDFDFDVEILVLNNNSEDYLHAQLVKESLKNNGINTEIKSYQDIGMVSSLNRIKSYDVYVSARLHGGICAYVLDTKFILFNYHKKCENFCLDIGYDNYLLNDHVSLELKIKYLLVNDLKIDKTREEFYREAESNFLHAPWKK